jgi:oligopeptide/dipeptide ABC transporter ATP-binding protein
MIGAPTTGPPQLLEVAGLRKWYELRSGIIPRVTGHVKAVDDVSFSLAPREVLGIAGESGSGKSTIGRCILRLIEPTAGEIRFRGENVGGYDVRALKAFRRHAQIVFQDPFASLDPTMTIEEIVGEPNWLQGMVASRPERRDRVAALLETVALGSEYLDRRPHELSGGQSQRVGIARALSVGPEMLVADEPVSSLDVSIQAQIINLLEDLKDRFGLTMLFISHDLAVMAHLADRIAVVYLGRIMEIAPKRELLNRPRHPYTEALLSAVPEPGTEQRQRIVLEGDVPNSIDPPSGCAFRTRCRYVQPQCALERPGLRMAGPGHFTACIRDDILGVRPEPGADAEAAPKDHRDGSPATVYAPAAGRSK